MSYKVGVILINKDLILLDLDEKNIPMWNLKKGSFPIETVKRNLKNMGLENKEIEFIEMIEKNDDKIYLYLVKDVEVLETNFTWIHKAVLLMNENYIPFSWKYMREYFE